MLTSISINKLDIFDTTDLDAEFTADAQRKKDQDGSTQESEEPRSSESNPQDRD